MKEPLNIINSLNIIEDSYVVLACSYGPDSMCLLDLLRKCNIKIVVAHVNHNFREESKKEYNDLKKYCLENNIVFEGIEIKEKPKNNIEAFARNFRYDFFEEIVNKYKAKYLFTAHHGDDLVETVLMRLIRGSSFGGYSGFKTIRLVDHYYMVRPLIYITKDEIINYVHENNIPYAIDKSNFESIYTRNKIRNEVLPILKEINPKIHKKFIKFSDIINEYNDYIEKETANLYSTLYLNNSIDLNEFNMLPILLKKTLLKNILFSIYGNNINRINDKHISSILDLIANEKVNSYITLPNNIIVRKYYNMIEFKNKEEITGYDLILDDFLNIDNFLIEKITKTDIIKSNFLFRLSSKDIKLPLRVRSKRVGDKMVLKNSGTKKVGEILSEKKLPKNQRERWPIVTDSDGQILWIPGVKKSQFDRQESQEYDIILKCIKKEEKDYEEKK